MTKRPSAARSVRPHDLDEQPVGAQRALGLAGGDQQVRVVEVDRVDIREVDEGLDLDRARLRGSTRPSSSSVSDDLLPVVEVVAVGDLLVGDLGVLLRAEALDLDRREVLLVQLAEVQVEVARRR